MDEPDNLTGWVDRLGGTWVRVDECFGQYGATWWPRSDGPVFEPQGRQMSLTAEHARDQHH